MAELSTSGKSNPTRDVEQEIYFMRQALRVAKAALDIGEVPVGCVIVSRDASVIQSTLPGIDIQVKHGATNESALAKSSEKGEIIYLTSPSVIVSHGANQVNATRDATRHAEIVAIDRMLTRGRSSDQMKLPLDVIRKSAHGKIPKAYSPGKQGNDDNWTNIPSCGGHWKNTFGWGSGRVYEKNFFSNCDLYVTCEPCIMVRRIVLNLAKEKYFCVFMTNKCHKILTIVTFYPQLSLSTSSVLQLSP